MTDIIDELRKVQRLHGDTYSSYEVIGMVGKAAAEIERLRAANDDLAHAVNWLRAENEQLLAEKLHWEHQNGLLEAEVERLRTAEAGQCGEKLWLERNEAYREIERLRDHHALNLGWEIRARKAEDEIERLRALLAKKSIMDVDSDVAD